MRITSATQSWSGDEESGRTESDPELVLDLGGFEGPLDLLLDLARRQKVDLHEISILALAEQYLTFVEAARSLRLELAADYLVMAAWLAYLKSRLLLPEPPKPEEPSAADLAGALARRIRLLDAIRAAARDLEARPRLGRDVFASAVPAGSPGVAEEGTRFAATLHDLLAAYARQSRRGPGERPAVVIRRAVWSLAEARGALERLVGETEDWFALEPHLARFLDGRTPRASVVASMFSAALEMAREGEAAIRQDALFGPLWLRRTPAPAEAAA